MSSKHQHSYQFREFRLDVAERTLLKHGESISLTPKVFDLLTVLVKKNGHLVDKDELLNQVWEDAFVEESNIARAIHSIRKTLGEDKKNKFIETVPKKGYRFVAEVEKLNGNGHYLKKDSNLEKFENQNSSLTEEKTNQSISQNAANNQNKISNSERINVRNWAFGSFLVLAVLTTVFWMTQNYQASSGNLEPKSIAVLPLKPINVKNRDPIYELGIAESLILKLSSVDNFNVRPLSAVRPYQELEQNPSEAGKELDVNLVLSSNYQLVDGKILVTSQLINVKSGSIEEVFRSEKSASNMFIMQDEIALDIGNKFLSRFGNKNNNQKTKRGTSNEEAYRLYLQAIFIFEQADKTDLSKALVNLERAIELDPNYTKVYISLAQVYLYSKQKGFDLSSETSYEKAKSTIDKALKLEPNSADAHATLGMIHFSKGEFAEAETKFKKAIQLDPNSAAARAGYSHYLSVQERFDESIREIKKAVEIDPTSRGTKVSHGMALYYAKRYDDAIAQFLQLNKDKPNFSQPYFWLWLLHDLKGDEATAYEWFIKYQTQIKTDLDTIQRYQNAYKKDGWKGILKQHILEDKKHPNLEQAPYLYYEIACFSTRIGDKNEAFKYLEKAYEINSPAMPLIKIDPYLEPLHGDPRFDELVKKVGLKHFN